MPLKELRNLLDFKQKASDKNVKMAALMSTVEEAKKKEVLNKSKQGEGITIKALMDELKPDLSFLSNVGLNTVRAYTLASWEPSKKYIDLVVALLPNGLTSNYFKRNPEYMRIRPVASSFHIPEDRPIVMIANGSGIAPFRSIVEYISKLPAEKRNFLRLYLI